MCLSPWVVIPGADLSMAAGVQAQPPRLNEAQESTMRELSAAVSATAPWASWNTTDPNPCLWSGVTCSMPPPPPSNNRSGSSAAALLRLSMSGFGLSDSSVPASLCSLDTLESLDLSRNRFTITDLPQNLSSCSLGAGLRALNLSYAQLAGPLGDFAGFRRLELLDLSFSYLTGNVSKQLSSLPKLRILNLSYNGLHGDLPTDMAISLEELVFVGYYA